MTSNDTDVSGHALINLIYRHLKENGHKEAARVLRKHAPKVETKGVEVSLNDIFRQWLSKKHEKKNVEDLLERCAGKIHTIGSSKNSVSKSKTADSVAAGKMKDTQKKKKAKTSKKPTAEHDSINPTTQDDSDSDSSLDVEKWKRLALQLSDADISKMDASTNFSTSIVASSNNSTKKQKAAKKDKNQPKGKNKSPTKKTKDKTSTSQSKADKTKMHSKSKPKEIASSEAGNNKSPSKNTKDRISVESTTAISLSEQVGIPKLDVTGHSKTDSMKVDKVRRKTMNGVSESNNTDTENGGFEKTDNLLLSKNTATPSRKAKSKKAFNLPECSETHHTRAEIGVQKTRLVLDNEMVKTPSKKLKLSKGQIVNPVDINNSEEAAPDDAISLLSSDQSKINDIANSEPAKSPSKKCKKSKKANKHAELEAEDTSSQRAGNDVDNYQLGSDQATATDQILGSGHIETPKKVKSKKSKPVDFATSSGEGTIEGFSSHSQPQQTKPQSKKSTAKDVNIAVVPPVETTPGNVKKSFVGLNETETPKKKESHLVAFSVSNNMSDAVISETPSKKSKKCKRKRSANVPPSATESECDNSQVGNGVVLSGTSIQGVKYRMGSENENESASAVEEGPPEPKKRKKNKKDKKKKTEIDEHENNIEEVSPTQPSDELTDSIPSSQKRKKKKKKHGDDEMQTMPTATPEEQTPRKKKKSKEKRHQ